MTPGSATQASPPHRRQRGLIDRHFAGQAAPGGERLMRAHLVECDDCRTHYERHLQLAAVDPQAAVARRDRLARGLGLPVAPAAARAPRRWFTLAAAACACAIALFMIGRPRTPPDVQPRAGVTAPGSQLLVYEVTAGGAVRQAISEVRADSALAFAYANIAQRRHLMVFAVDETRRVYWYYPAWEKPTDNPIAIDIERDEASHELPQAISHRFVGRHLQLYGVFVDRALSVREIETLVAGSAGDGQPPRIDVPEAAVTRLDLTVVDGR